MQTSYSTNPPIGRAGMIADSRIMRHVQSRLAAGPIRAGQGVFRVPGYGQPGTHVADPGQVYQSSGQDVAADVDAILATGGASAAGIQVIQGAALNGILGAVDLIPARKVTLILSNHADWDATTAVIRYTNQDGVVVEENLAIPNAGNTTLTTAGYVKRVTSLTIPAQSGAGGTFTMGVAILDASVVAADFDGVAIYDAAHSPGPGASAYIPATGAGVVAEYADGDSVPCLYKGPVWVVTEDACVAGAAVYCRVVSAAGGAAAVDLGNFRSDNAGGNAVLIANARWGRDSGIGGLNILEMY